MAAMKGAYFEFLDRQQSRNDVAPLPMMTQRAATTAGTQIADHARAKPEADCRTGKQKQLTTYGWVNSKSGVMHIPVDQAMKLLAERGLPASG